MVKLKWHVSAGGTAAARGKRGYDTVFASGKYIVQPVSNQYGHHRGYQVYFLNTKGELEGGLYQSLGLFRSPNEAKGVCKKHFDKHFWE